MPIMMLMIYKSTRNKFVNYLKNKFLDLIKSPKIKKTKKLCLVCIEVPKYSWIKEFIHLSRQMNSNQDLDADFEKNQVKFFCNLLCYNHLFFI